MSSPVRSGAPRGRPGLVGGQQGDAAPIGVRAPTRVCPGQRRFGLGQVVVGDEVGELAVGPAPGGRPRAGRAPRRRGAPASRPARRQRRSSSVHASAKPAGRSGHWSKVSSSWHSKRSTRSGTRSPVSSAGTLVDRLPTRPRAGAVPAHLGLLLGRAGRRTPGTARSPAAAGRGRRRGSRAAPRRGCGGRRRVAAPGIAGREVDDGHRATRGELIPGRYRRPVPARYREGSPRREGCLTGVCRPPAAAAESQATRTREATTWVSTPHDSRRAAQTVSVGRWPRARGRTGRGSSASHTAADRGDAVELEGGAVAEHEDQPAARPRPRRVPDGRGECRAPGRHHRGVAVTGEVAADSSVDAGAARRSRRRRRPRAPRRRPRWWARGAGGEAQPRAAVTAGLTGRGDPSGHRDGALPHGGHRGAAWPPRVQAAGEGQGEQQHPSIVGFARPGSPAEAGDPGHVCRMTDRVR